ncbi:hypothetical protein G3A43_06360 [Paraburkholderia aspalathi]|nr:hypothetical protein [Paraburkholderia aspalathi]MBK3779871.1 hypothetical protein [Paraburkholderia aspalathi]
MRTQLILARSTSGCAALFVNQSVVAEANSTAEIDKLVDTAARKLAAALGVPLVECTVDAPADGNWVWSDLYALLPPVAEQIDKAGFVVYGWREDWREPDTQRGPGEYADEMCFDIMLPKPGTPYFVLAPLHEVRAETTTSVLVKQYNAYECELPTDDTHQLEIVDSRQASGQARLVLGALDGEIGDFLDVLMEVNLCPLDGLTPVQCLQVHVDADDPVISLFKVGERILVRPNTGVKVESEVIDCSGQPETVFWLS